MKRILFTILILIQFLFSIEDYFILDSLHSDIDVLLNYEKESKKFSTKLEKLHFFNSIAFKLYDKVLNLQLQTVMTKKEEKWDTFNVGDSTGTHLALIDSKDLKIEYIDRVIKKYKLDPEKPNPITI